MKRYTITVNGTPYDVTVDENGASAPAAAPVAAPAAPVAAPAAPAAVAAPAPAAAPAAVPADAQAVNAPMPGTILDVKVSVGDTVTSGQVLCVLEAMKMENDIVSPADAKIVAIHVNKGDSVESGTPLLSLN